jgi:predicted RNase H-like HicB family nuclease
MDTPGNRFSVCVHRTRGGFIARVIEIPGCVARGDSEVQAIENVRNVIRTFALVARLLEQDKPTVRVEISA